MAQLSAAATLTLNNRLESRPTRSQCNTVTLPYQVSGFLSGQAKPHICTAALYLRSYPKNLYHSSSTITKPMTPASTTLANCSAQDLP